MTYNLRVDRVTGRHVGCTLFVEHRNCGCLTLDIGEYQAISAALRVGGGALNLIDVSDDRVFAEWTQRCAVP